jgi:peptidoglycan/LPS O-acetylase OafA/YrhL
MTERRFLGQLANGRDNNFNLIRMLAASGVILSHAYPLGLGPDTPEPFEEFLKGDNLGGLCVFVFFAISGFFISASFDRRKSIADFVLCRALRIYPGLIVMLLVMFPLVGWIEGQGTAFWNHFPIDIVNSVVMFFRFGDVAPPYRLFADNPYPGAFNGSLWTLRFEIMCYAGVVIAGCLGIFRHRGAALVVLVLAVLGSYFLPMITGQYDFRRLSYLGLSFAYGAAAYVWRNHLVMDGRIVVALLALAAVLQPTGLFFSAMILACSYTVIWLGHANIPALKAYNRLGDYSYGVYIYAFPIEQLVARGGITQPLALAAVTFVLTLICAVLSWYVVEKPALGLRHRVFVTAPRT